MSHLHVLLYIDGEEPPVVDEKPVHWKSIIPKLDGTVITDFVLLATQGSKRLFYCLFNTSDPKYAKVKAWVLANKVALGLKWWVGATALDVWKEVFKDRTTDDVANAMIKNLIKYPMTVNGVQKFVKIKDVAGLGGTVTWSYYLTANTDAVLPHKFFDGSAA